MADYEQGSPRYGMEATPWASSGNDAYDRMTGKGAYYVAPAPSSSGGGGSAPAPPPPVPHNPWVTESTYVAPTGIKQATPDIIVFDDTSISPEFLVEAFFERFGGSELISISRADLINGDDVSYSPIKNLSSLRRRYNPNNIIAIGVYQQNLRKYSINLTDRGPTDPYFDASGNLIVHIDTMTVDEYIEVEVAADGTMNRIES